MTEADQSPYRPCKAAKVSSGLWLTSSLPGHEGVRLSLGDDELQRSSFLQQHVTDLGNEDVCLDFTGTAIKAWQSRESRSMGAAAIFETIKVRRWLRT